MIRQFLEPAEAAPAPAPGARLAAEEHGPPERAGAVRRRVGRERLRHDDDAAARPQQRQRGRQPDHAAAEHDGDPARAQATTSGLSFPTAGHLLSSLLCRLLFNALLIMFFPAMNLEHIIIIYRLTKYVPFKIQDRIVLI